MGLLEVAPSAVTDFQAQVVQVCKKGRRPPLTADAFAAVLASKHFTNGKSDHALVVRLYAEYLSEALGSAVALGFGGDRTENLLWRLQHGELDGMAPRAVVLLIGTNNTGERLEDPALTVAGIRANLDEIRRRQPQAKVLLLALLPRDEKPDGLLRRHNAKINALLPTLADGRQVVFLDIGSTLTNPDGTLSRDILPDWLHLSPKGYDLWARSLAPLLTSWLMP